MARPTMDSLYFCITERIPSKKNGKEIRRRKNGQRFVSSSNDYINWEAKHVALMAKWRGRFR